MEDRLDQHSEATDETYDFISSADSKRTAPQPAMRQLELTWDLPGIVPATELALSKSTPVEPRSLEKKPRSASPPDSGQRERIRDLELAVDQCQIYIQELKNQLADQEFLEAQLAATEETSQIQQQAIATLKGKLTEQESLAAQLNAVLQHNQELQGKLLERETHCQAQQVELETLRGQLTQDQQDLCDRQGLIADLEVRLQRTQEALSSQQEIIAALQKNYSSDSEKNKVIQGLSKNLLSVQSKFEALETEYSSQMILQAKLQHSCQELESQRSFYLERIQQLERQVAEMQEQILQQAKQASEYEAAVQHWKDHCLFAEQSVLQLKSVLEQILTDRNLLELMNTTKDFAAADAASGPLESSDSVSSRFLRHLKIDLPAFLHLKRSPRS